MLLVRRRPYIAILLCISFFAACYIVVWNHLTIKSIDTSIRFVQKINGTCALPVFNIETYTFNHGAPLCSSSAMDCVTLRGNRLFFKNDCFYRKLTRKGDFNIDYSGWHSSSIFLDSEWQDGEILEVRCPSNSIFDQYCIYRKVDRNEALLNNSSSQIRSNKTKFPMSVLAIGLDSMSRHTYTQQLSKSLSFFMTDLGGILFNGHAIVGDGTTAAFLAMLAGVFEDDVHETRRGFNGAKSLDDLPFIWKNLHQHGYITLHDETEPETGTFQLRLLGFDSPPVHYYGRPFQFATVLGKSSNNYHPVCLGDKSRFREGLDNTFDFFVKYKNEKKFAIFFNGILTHQEKSRGEMLDDDLLNYLKQIKAAGLLDNTMLILFSDHGPRYGKSRQTIFGKYEERSPFLAIAMPSEFSQQYPEVIQNMKWNADFILTTPFDLHATFMDMLGDEVNENLAKGRSLFSRLPANRTCEEASVASHWCPCANGAPVEITSNEVTSAMKTFLSTVNEDWLKTTGSSCFRLKSAVPISASVMHPGAKMASFEHTVDGHGRVPSFRHDKSTAAYFLIVSFKTEPGGGTWEATFDVDPVNGISVQRSQVSRTNVYGNAADCIANIYPHLRAFCVCDFGRLYS